MFQKWQLLFSPTEFLEKIRSGEETFIIYWNIGDYDKKRKQIKKKIEECIQKPKEQPNATTDNSKRVEEGNIKLDYIEYKKKILSETPLKYKYEL